MKYLLILLLIITSSPIKSQVTEELVLNQIDSLKELRGKERETSLPIAVKAYENAKTLENNKLIGIIANEYGIILWLDNDFIGAEQIFKESIPIAEFNERLRLQTNLAAVYYDLGKVDSAFFYNEKVISDLKTIGDSINLVRPTLSMIQLLKQTGNYSEALERILSIKKLVSETEDFGLINRYNNLFGNTLMDLKDYSAAINQFEYNIKFIESIEDQNYQIRALEDKARALNNIGLSYFHLKDRKKAIEYYDQALEINKETNSIRSIGITTFNKAEAYLDENDLIKAELYAIESYNIFKDINEKKGEMVSNAVLGDIYTQRNLFNKADEKYITAEQMAVEMNLTSDLLALYENWSELKEKQKDYKTALKYYKERRVLNDSLFNTEKQQRIDVLRTQYEVFKKDTELERKQKGKQTRNFLMILLSLCGISLLSIGLAFYAFKKRNKEVEIKEEVLKNSLMDRNAELFNKEGDSDLSLDMQSERSTNENLKSKSPTLTLINRNKDKLLLKEITHISTKGGIGVAHYYYTDRKEPFEDYQTLKNLIEYLKSLGFIQIHKSHLINTKHFVDGNLEKIKLSNGKTLDIGRAFKKNVRAFYRSLEKHKNQVSFIRK